MINIKLEEHLTQTDIEVLIKYAKMNRMVSRLVTLIQSVESVIKCSADNAEMWINASEIYYAESVDKCSFVYTEKSVYRTDLRLYQLIDELTLAGFAQVNKSCILNLNYLQSVRALSNSRMEGLLANGERVTVTRRYIAEIKAKLLER